MDNRNVYDFNSTQDHSKWAVARDNPWICIGDLNRSVSPLFNIIYCLAVPLHNILDKNFTNIS